MNPEQLLDDFFQATAHLLRRLLSDAPADAQAAPSDQAEPDPAPTTADQPRS